MILDPDGEECRHAVWLPVADLAVSRPLARLRRSGRQGQVCWNVGIQVVPPYPQFPVDKKLFEQRDIVLARDLVQLQSLLEQRGVPAPLTYERCPAGLLADHLVEQR